MAKKSTRKKSKKKSKRKSTRTTARSRTTAEAECDGAEAAEARFPRPTPDPLRDRDVTDLAAEPLARTIALSCDQDTGLLFFRDGQPPDGRLWMRVIDFD